MYMEISKKMQIFWENPICASVEMNAARKKYWGRVFSLVANDSEDLKPVRGIFVIKEKIDDTYLEILAKSFEACGN